MNGAQKSDLVSKGRSCATKFIRDINEFRAFDNQFVGQDGETELTDDDFTGENAGITKSEFVAAVKTIRQVLDSLPADASKALYQIVN